MPAHRAYSCSLAQPLFDALEVEAAMAARQALDLVARPQCVETNAAVLLLAELGRIRRHLEPCNRGRRRWLQSASGSHGARTLELFEDEADRTRAARFPTLLCAYRVRHTNWSGESPSLGCSRRLEEAEHIIKPLRSCDRRRCRPTSLRDTLCTTLRACKCTIDDAGQGAAMCTLSLACLRGSCETTCKSASEATNDRSTVLSTLGETSSSSLACF